MRTRIQRLQRRKTVTAVLVLAVLVFAFRVWQTNAGIPLSMTGPNLVANNDFMLDADGNGMPDGWTPAFPDGKGINRTNPSFTVNGTGQSISIAGSSNWLKSPLVMVHPGETYRASFQGLADNTEANSPTTVELWFHWRDARGTEFSVEYSAAQTVPFRKWALISGAFRAPARATQLAVSIHPLTDDRIVVDQFQLGQTGVHIGQWPNGKQAAVAFSFDYETAMGGLVHSRSEDDPNAGTNYLERATRMRAGADAMRQRFTAAGISGTWYSNGYNFLTGNRDGRTFMGDPTYSWANTAPGHRWSTDYWATHRWFEPDPHTDEQTNPQWYFGSQVAQLVAAGQDIQSHTFAHFHGSYVTPQDWAADLAAWSMVAGEHGIAPATSLAFPWSSSAGMTWQSWEVLATHGIRSLTRTNVTQPRFALADRTTYALRPLPSHPAITVIADEYVQPAKLDRLEQRLNTALVQHGAIDFWAHTEEAVTPEQQQAWQTLIDRAKAAAWVAPVPVIVAYQAAVAQVQVSVTAEQPQYRFTVRNQADQDLPGLTLTLPFQPGRLTVGGTSQAPSSTQLQLDLPAHNSIEITLWPA